MDKSYFELGNNIATNMEKNSYYLLDLYEKNPLFDEWDFNSLKQSLSTDIYIINDQHVITNSTVEGEVNKDFKKCCEEFTKILDKRRNSGEFYHDGIGVEQKSGKIKKFSYIGTPDKKYIIELGHNLEEDPIYNAFHFNNIINRFKKKSPSIYEINVLNPNSYYLGTSQNNGQNNSPDNGQKIPEERLELFEHTRETGETTEYKGVWNNEPAIYRYVQYVSIYDYGLSKTKVLEIIYNKEDLQTILKDYKNNFIN